MSNKIGGFTLPETLLQSLPTTVLEVEQYFGSFVRLNCASAGGKELQIRIYLTDWRFLHNSELLADSEGAANDNNLHLAGLKSQRLLQVIAVAREVRLDFTEGFSLRLKANLEEYEPNDELLLIYMDSALVKFFPDVGFALAPPVSWSKRV